MKEEYTPFGYLDNPYHNWRLQRSGVLRSQAPVGFTWHYPSYAGAYNRTWLYRATLLLGIAVNGDLLLEPDDFVAHRIALSSSYHTKNILRYDWEWPARGVDCCASFFSAGEDVLCSLFKVVNRSPVPLTLTWYVACSYQRNLAASSFWEHDIFTYDGGGHILVLGAYPEGEVIACLAEGIPRGVAVATDLAGLRPWMMYGDSPVPVPPRVEGDPSSVIQRAGALGYEIVLIPGASEERMAIMGRGDSDKAALAALYTGMNNNRRAYESKQQEDARFWKQAPRLRGDWPPYWRRGLTYDFETLRMVVRPPLGIYRSPWDGMQIQVPRVVLAEAALDMLLLSYADPNLAQQVLLGTFADATAANIPCTREDGSYNMVAEDGKACGTAPEWCFPVYCLDLIHQRSGVLRWLYDIYPQVGSYIRWWLAERTNEQGWLFYHCSWESGQDNSPRFGPQQSGGTIISHIYPVDLQAAVSQAAAILSRWAGELNRPAEVKEWAAVAGYYREKTQSLWREDWFYDFDARTNTWSPVKDALQLAPVFGKVVTAEQCAALEKSFSTPPAHGERWPALWWSPVAFTVIEGAGIAGQAEIASTLSAELVDRIYLRADARDERGGLPGVAREYWPESGGGGAEGYGWGALGILLILRHIVGFKETEENSFTLTPALPAHFLRPEAIYRAGPLQYRGGRMLVTYRVQAATLLDVSLAFSSTEPSNLRVEDPKGDLLYSRLLPARWHRVRFHAKPFQTYRISW